MVGTAELKEKSSISQEGGSVGTFFLHTGVGTGE